MIMSRTVFNEAQLELLNVMASVKDDAELLALKHAISEFFARRADEEMEKFWQSGEWNEQTLQDLKVSEDAHFRVLDTIPFPSVSVKRLEEFMHDLEV